MLSEAFGGPAPWGVSPPSIWQSLSQSASRFPHKLAIASLHQKANLYDIDADHAAKIYLRWSYSDLLKAVNNFSSSLRKLGLRRGDAIATFLPNGVEFVVAFWTAHKLGCTFIPIHPRTLTNNIEASHMLKVTNAKLVLVQDDVLAQKFDDLININSSLKHKILVSGQRNTSAWISLGDLLRHRASLDDSTQEQGHSSLTNEPPVTVLFTSGTTALPKGCPHSDTTLNAFFLNLSRGGQSETDIFCSVLPNNHAMCYFYSLYFFCHGGAVVFPSTGFEATSMLQALEAEQCTHTCLVPTALHALLDSIRSRGVKLRSSLIDVCLAGASITPDNVRQVVNDLGSQGISTGFGMTEGSPIWTAFQENPEELIREGLTLVGTPSPGVRVRICAPDSRMPLPRGEKGEIHQSGPGVIPGYLDGVGSENFYKDEHNQQWFISGDQAIMFEDGMITVTGRYKDMIIRGGENISPASIEAILNKFQGIQVQVVGAVDAIAGEVPVAVIKGAHLANIRTLQNAVSQTMGPAFVPAEFVRLEGLGFDDFPKTTSGKVQKAKLAEAIRMYRQQQEAQNDTMMSEKLIHETITRAWFKATGISVDHLDLDAPYTDFADSIAVMRVRDSLRKELGLSISADDIIQHSSIRSQIELMRYQRTPVAATQPMVSPSRGPPSIDELSITFGSETKAVRMQKVMAETVASKGFEWSEDVADVIPAIDYMSVLAESKLIDTWNFAIAIMADGSSTAEMRTALEKTLSNNTILNSFYVLDCDRNVYYIRLRPSKKLLDTCIIDHEAVQKPEDVQLLAMEYPYRDHATAPGPLFRCLVIHIEQTKSTAMIMYVHHIVQDASFTRLVYEDLEQALAKPDVPLRPHADFKIWADSYKALRHSPAATISVNYHINRLKDLHLHKKALYPIAHIPRKAIEETPDGLDFGFDAPGLADLKKSHPDLTAAVVLKAAMALVNVNRTGYSHAVFNNFEAGRGPFPFQPDSVRALNPDAFEAADIGGPTMEGVCNLVEVPRRESAISLLKRMQQEQLELTKHCHAPIRRVIDGLNKDGNGSGDMMVEVHRTHFLTWIPGFLGDYEHIRVAQIAIRCIAGLVVVAGIGGPAATTYMMSMRWDVANYSRSETGVFVEDLKRAILWMTDKKNWDVPVKVFLGELKHSQEETKTLTVAEVTEVVGDLDAESH